MSLQAKLRQGILWCLVLPVALIGLGINVAVFRHFKKANEAELDQIAQASLRTLERATTAEALRLQSMAILPNVEQLLSVAERANRNLSIGGRRERILEVEEQWAALSRDEVLVRNVLNNAVGEMFAHLVENEPALDTLLLTDTAGALLAASDKLARYDYGEDEWWLLARSQGAQRVATEGLSSAGTLGLALSVWSMSGETPVMRGVLRAELTLSELLSSIDWPDITGDWAVALHAGDTWTVAGEPDSETWAPLFEQAVGTQGRANGLQFRTYAFMPEVAWLHKASLVVARPQSAFPPPVLIPVLISTLLTLAVIAGLVVLAFVAGRKIFFEPYSALLGAGEWVMQNALGEQTDARAALDLSVPTSAPKEMREKLDSWLSMLQENARISGEAINNEMQSDLELAKDFQLAYLNRPHPKIPEVHYEGRLRLKFHHNYQPALALGGDFFDFIPLATDTVGVFVADVMGHGARSALITAILRTLLRDLAGQGRNARHYITEVNRQFCETLRSFPHPLFASAFYFVGDTTSRMATFSTAGHPAPYHIKRSTGRITRLESPSPHGAALGIIADETFTGGHARLLAGDVFVFFTDGVYEAFNEKGQEFGLARMEKVLRDNMYKGVETIVNSMTEAVMEFCGNEPVHDDICVVGVEVTTAAEDPEETKPSTDKRA